MHEDRGKVNSVTNNDANPLVGTPIANLGKVIAFLVLIALGLVYSSERGRAQQRGAILGLDAEATHRAGGGVEPHAQGAARPLVGARRL